VTEVTDQKAFVTLCFARDELDPRDISAILPVEPTRAHRKGEEFFAGPNAGYLPGRTGIWFIATDKLVPSDDLADHLPSSRHCFPRSRAMMAVLQSSAPLTPAPPAAAGLPSRTS
jgi:hypothetical protein